MHHDLEDEISPIVVQPDRAGTASPGGRVADLEGAEESRSSCVLNTGEVFHGLITGVQSYGFFVEIEELLVEGLVHVSSLEGRLVRVPGPTAKAGGAQKTVASIAWGPGRCPG